MGEWKVLLMRIWRVRHGLTLQVWNDEDPDDEVLAMVVRTGCNSTIGNMLRRAMRPSHFLSATDSLVKASCALSSAPTPSLHAEHQELVQKRWSGIRPP